MSAAGGEPAPGPAGYRLPGGTELLRAVSRRRGLLAGGLAAAAVATALPSLAPAPPPTTTVLALARDLPAGTTLSAGDLVPLDLPRQAVPDGAVTGPDHLVGRLLAGAGRRGEPVTDVRVVSPGLLAGLPDGFVAVPVRLADAATVRLLRAGDAVDVLAADSTPGSATAATIAAGAPVLAVPADDGGFEGALVVVAAPAATAARLAAAAVSSRLSVVVRR